VTKQLQTLALVFALVSTATVRAQDKPAAAKEANAPVVPLKVQVVISRQQGEKKISSMPYNLSMNAGKGANLRMGSKIPVAMSVFNQDKGNTAASFNYQDVGTNIDCVSTLMDDGRVALSITVDDSSVYPDEQVMPGGVKGNASFRSFRAVNSMILKDGQTGQFASATDKLTGETVKVDVTLTVVK
jgi:type II secretory pathway component GspD/PulD (secretin)